MTANERIMLRVILCVVVGREIGEAIGLLRYYW